MVKLAVLGKQVREKIELVSILGRKYSFVNEFSVKGEKKFVYFSNLLKTFGEFFFVKGILTCESAICINKCKQTFPRKCQFQEKGLSFSNGGSISFFFFAGIFGTLWKNCKTLAGGRHDVFQ